MNSKSDAKKMKKILREHGIKMNVSGCGWCGSPYVFFEYEGEILVDDSDADFDTEEDT